MVTNTTIKNYKKATVCTLNAAACLVLIRHDAAALYNLQFYKMIFTKAFRIES